MSPQSEPVRFDGGTLLARQVLEELACAESMTASALAYTLGAPMRDIVAALSFLHHADRVHQPDASRWAIV